MPNYQTVSVNQTPSNGTDYPFIDPPEEVRYLFGDLFLSYVDDECNFRPPFRVTWLAGFGAIENIDPVPYGEEHDRDITILDADDNVVFNTIEATDYSEFDWGTELKVYEWRKDNTVLRVTRHTLTPSGTSVAAGLNFYIGTNAVLDPRTYMRQPRSVTGLRVGLDFLQGDVALEGGYNIRLQVADEVKVDGGRRVRQINIRGRAGDGVGLVPACQSTDLVVKRINATGPTDAGDFKITAKDCYRLQRPVKVITSSPRTVRPWHPLLTDEKAKSALVMFNDCAPCCDCDDFIHTYEGIRKMYAKYKFMGERAEAVRDQYALNIERWNNQKNCREIKAPRLIVQGEPNNRLFVGASFCNMTAGCLGPVVLRLTFQTFNDGGPTDCTGNVRIKCRENRRRGTDTNGLEMVFDPTGEYPVYDIWFDQVPPQTTASFKMRFIMDCSDANGLDTAQVTLSVHSEKPTDPATGRFLPFTQEPPFISADIEALWNEFPVPFPCHVLTTITSSFGVAEGCRRCE